MKVLERPTRVHRVTEDQGRDLVALGRAIAERRGRLGMTKTELAREARIDRGLLGRIEQGEASPRGDTIGKTLATLDRLEHEMSMDLPSGVRRIGDPEDDLIELRVEGIYGAQRAVVKGPIRDSAALQAAMRELLESLQRGGPATESEDPGTSD